MSSYVIKKKTLLVKICGRCPCVHVCVGVWSDSVSHLTSVSHGSCGPRTPVYPSNPIYTWSLGFLQSTPVEDWTPEHVSRVWRHHLVLLRFTEYPLWSEGTVKGKFPVGFPSREGNWLSKTGRRPVKDFVSDESNDRVRVDLQHTIQWTSHAVFLINPFLISFLRVLLCRLCIKFPFSETIPFRCVQF